MSRSYKKTPYCKDGNGSSKKAKQLANRKFRRNKKFNIATKGKQYKKNYCSWDINDYVVYWTKKDAIKLWNDEVHEAANLGIELEKFGYHKEYKTLENYLYHCWKKWFKKK